MTTAKTSKTHAAKIAANGDWRKLLTPAELTALTSADPGAALRRLRPARLNDDKRYLRCGSLDGRPARRGKKRGLEASQLQEALPPVSPLPDALPVDSLSDDLVAFVSAPVSCVCCGQRIGANRPRLTHSDTGSDGKVLAVVYCSAKCAAKLPPADALRLRDADWMAFLRASPRLRRAAPQVWRLWRAGLRQARIAARLTNQHQRVTQSDVSRILSAIRAARVEASKAQRAAYAAERTSVAA